MRGPRTLLPIRALRLPALLLPVLLLPALPLAAACSWAPVPPLDRLRWPHEDLLVGNVGLAWGTLDARTLGGAEGTAGEGAVVLAEELPWDAVVSPDGRWAASLRAGEAPPDQTVFDSCGFHLPRHVLLHDRETGQTRLLGGERVAALVPTPGALLVLDEDGFTAYAWGEWDAPRRQGAPGGLALKPYPVHVTVSPDGSALAWHSDDGGVRLARMDRAVGTHRPPEGAHVAHVAFSPDGAHAALVEGTWDAGWRVRVVEAREGLATLAEAPLGPGRPTGLDWGAGGLAAATTRDDEGARTALVRVFRDPLRLGDVAEKTWSGRAGGGVAWSPGGDRLALGHQGGEATRLVLLDGGDLRTSGDLRTALDAPVLVQPRDWPQWHAALEREVPPPPPPGSRAIPAAGPGLVLVGLALAAGVAAAASGRVAGVAGRWLSRRG